MIFQIPHQKKAYEECAAPEIVFILNYMIGINYLFVDGIKNRVLNLLALK